MVQQGDRVERGTSIRTWPPASTSRAKGLGAVAVVAGMTPVTHSARAPTATTPASGCGLCAAPGQVRRRSGMRPYPRSTSAVADRRPGARPGRLRVLGGPVLGPVDVLLQEDVPISVPSGPRASSSARTTVSAAPTTWPITSSAGVEAWLGARVDGPALERARTTYAFFADYAGLASWPVTRRELRALDMPSVVLTGPRSPAHVVAAADALAGLMPAARPANDGDLAAAARTLLASPSGRRCVLGSVKARRPPVALLARACRAQRPGRAAPPAAPRRRRRPPRARAILAPRPAIELPVQVAPGLSLRVRRPGTAA